MDWWDEYIRVRSEWSGATSEGTILLEDYLADNVLPHFIEQESNDAYAILEANAEEMERWHLPKPESAAKQYYDFLMEYFKARIHGEEISIAEAARRAGISPKSIYNLLSFLRHVGHEPPVGE